MDQLSIFSHKQQTWRVGELNRYLRQLLESDSRLQDLWISGEISNLSRPASGHIYFTLKDREGTLRCVIWRSYAAQLQHSPQNGDAVEAHGYISIYEAGGQYQLYADRIHPIGAGDLFHEFIVLKEKLAAEGLFAEERKRLLPAWPHRIGVVTSPTAAALQDTLNVLRRRYPMAEVILSPTAVQGERAPAEIVRAIQRLNQLSQPDVILLIRGGGSMEDLWAFNEENVVRATAASTAPLISGIGHESDLILTDFAADMRAPTPSAAAELATPDRDELKLELAETTAALQRAFKRILSDKRLRLIAAQARMQIASPYAQIANARQQVDSFQERAARASSHLIELKKNALNGKIHALTAMGPPAVLERGYAIVSRHVDGAIVSNTRQTRPGDNLSVQVRNGTFDVSVLPANPTTPDKLETASPE